MNERIDALRGFLDASHSAYHAQAYLARELDNAGYTRLRTQDAWALQPGGKYYLVQGGTSLIAFRVPQETPKGFLMSASHCDRPTFKLKDDYELTGIYSRVNTEVYGGMLMTTWLDRPLSIAGRVLVETDEGVAYKLVDIDQDLLLIPNVAIHMNRQINEGHKWNPAVDMVPLVGGSDDAGKLRALLEDHAGGKILGHDLYLYIRQKSTVWGIDGEFLSSTALDDLECVWGSAQGFLHAGKSGSIPVLCVFDNEEIGSGSAQGAGSTLLPDTLSRICDCLGISLHRMLAQSFMVSADNAHALHPNHPELADPANAPVLGRGIVLKYNASMKYCTDGTSAAIMRMVCEKAGVPLQTYHNRADIPGGSTLGHVSLAQVSVPTVDIGLPQLAMHSTFETAAVADMEYLEKAMEVYYSTTLEASENGYILR